MNCSVTHSMLIPLDYYYGKKNQRVLYEPEFNKKNVFLRRGNKVIPIPQYEAYQGDPLTQLLQYQADMHRASKRFVRDKLDISDIAGVKSNVYGRLKDIEGRHDYMNTDGIAGAQPSPLKQNQPRDGPDFKLYDKDINPNKWVTKRMVNPLFPEYEVSTKSGRMMRIGTIDKNTPQPSISKVTRRIANFTKDIEGSTPKKSMAITELQRQQVMSNNSSLPFNKMIDNSRNSAGIFEHYTAPSKPVVKQSEFLQPI